MTKPLAIFDIETIPSAKALAMEPPEEWLVKGVRENYKPETVEAHRAKQRAGWAAEIAEQAALDWRLGSIVAIGHWIPDAEPWIGLVSPSRPRPHLGLITGGVVVDICSYPTEQNLLQAAWTVLRQTRKLVGFGIQRFDIPWLLGRSGALGVPATRPIDNRRYNGGDVFDWADLLASYDWSAAKGWTLARYAEWFELEDRPWGSGADIRGWVEAGDLESVARHLVSDLRTTAALHARFAPAFFSPTAHPLPAFEEVS